MKGGPDVAELVEMPSRVSGNRFRVSLDVYGLNPLADDFRQVNPATYDVALSKAGPPPKMFAGGTADLPAFTASGIDPTHLLKLPYTARHHAAALADPSAAHGIFEQYADDPHVVFDHEGLQAAVVRMREWASGRMDRLPTDVEALPL